MFFYQKIDADLPRFQSQGLAGRTVTLTILPGQSAFV